MYDQVLTYIKESLTADLITNPLVPPQSILALSLGYLCARTDSEMFTVTCLQDISFVPVM